MPTADLRQGTDAIQLGWDDEQIAIWLNRQADIQPNRELALDAPCGVAGYRVDVREQGDAAWHSLMRTKSIAALALGAIDLGSFEGEGLVEAIPSQDAKAMHGEFWLPPYFASWRGGSLALGDANIAALQKHAESQVGDLRPATPADAGESLRRRGRHRRTAPLRPVVRVPGPPRRSHARRPGLELSINRRRLPPA